MEITAEMTKANEKFFESVKWRKCGRNRETETIAPYNTWYFLKLFK